MRIDTLPSTSCSRRCLRWREVRYLPSRPASGELFTPNVIPQHRFVHRETWQGERILLLGNGVADLYLRKAGHDKEIAGDSVGDIDAAKAGKAHELGEAAA